MIFSQLLVNSLISGSIYALVASGFSLIYSTNRFMHFAHGIAVTIGAYMLYWLFTLVNLPVILAIILSIAITTFSGYAMNEFLYNPLQKRKSSSVILLIASVGILILVENLIAILFNSRTKSIGLIDINTGFQFAGATITLLQIIIILTSIIILITFHLIMKKTRLGRELRAVSDNKELASITGINQQKITTYSFMIGSALAGVAGILIALEQNLTPIMGTGLIVKGFTGSIIGGVTSVPGSVLGSYILGLAENFGIWFIPTGYKDAIAFSLLFLFLLFKPTGLFGIDRGVRQ